MRHEQNEFIDIQAGIPASNRFPGIFLGNVFYTKIKIGIQACIPGKRGESISPLIVLIGKREWKWECYLEYRK